MESVESVFLKSANIQTLIFNTKEIRCEDEVVNDFEPELIKRISGEVLKLGVEPGEFSFEYNDDKNYYQVNGNNQVNHLITEVKIIDITSDNRLKRKINNYDTMVLLGEMASGFVHDLGNQLMVILSATELLESGNIDIRKKTFSLLRKTSKNASDLVQNILAYMRNEINIKSNVNLGDVINESVSLFKHLASDKVRILTNGVSDDLFILAERKSILNVFLNLLINALDAVGKSGEISIDVSIVNLAFLPQNSAFFAEVKGTYYKASVTDNGAGIKEEDIDKIFIPFYTTKKHKGTGLGLANAAMIMEENKGIITCQSKPDCGTSFDLYFPSINVYHNKNVLVISDDINFLTLAKKVCPKYNYEFHYYATQVGKIFYEEHFAEISYVISDKEFNGVDGLKVLVANVMDLKKKVSKFL